MRRRAIVTTLLTALLAMSLSDLGSGVLQAQTTLFGPITYTRTAGPPNQFSDTFILPAGTTAPYTIHIVNGQADGTKRISSATIKLNGVQVAGPSDFGQNVAVIDRPVALHTNNTLEVRLTSAPGSFLTISVLDTGAGSQPTAMTPNPLNLAAGTTGTLTATLAPAPTAAGTVTVSSANPAVATVPTSVSFTAAQTTVPITVTAIAAGSTTVTATLNGGSAASQVTVSPALPTIIGFTPTSGQPGTSVTITGTNFINVQTVIFNGIPATFTGTSPTTLIAVVPPTATTGPLAVQTLAGTATSAASFTVLPAPTITSLQPATLSMVLGSTGTLAVTLDAVQTTDTVVTLASSTPAVATVSSSITVPATQLSAPIAVTAVALGQADITASLNGTNATSTVTVSPGPPSITSFSPASGPIGTVVTLTGRFSPTLASNQVTMGGTPVIASSVNSAGTSLVVTVPTGSASGLVSVATPQGTATSMQSFTLVAADFTVSALPTPLTIPAFGQASFSVALTGTNGFSTLAALAVANLPAGMTAQFSSGALASGQATLLTLTTGGTTPAGTYPITITATSAVDGVATPRSVTVSVHVLATGLTTLSGQILDEEAQPVEGALIKLGLAQVSTDEGGNFLLQNPPVGANQLLLIDGTPASAPGKSLPAIPLTVTIVAGQANALRYTPYLHFQKTTGLVNIANSAVERLVTDPDLPGFQLRIPAGAQIIGWDGQPNTQMSVRRVPMDRLPVPPPPADRVAGAAYMDYFDKVGGGTPSEPIPVTLPNDLDLPPGAQAELWYFDEAPDGSRPNQWAQYGTGTVSPDGSRIMPDIDPATGKSYGQPRFCCGINMAAILETARQFYFGGGAPSAGGDTAGDPVDLATGLLMITKTDLVLPGRLPIALTRTYQTNGTATGPFGRGTTHAAQMAVLIQGNQRIVRMGDGRRFAFTQQPDGTFRNTTDGLMQGVVLTEPGGIPTLRWKDGARWVFGASVNPLTRGLTQQIDRNQNTLTNLWSGQRITAITGPDGRQLTFAYDALNRITRVTDPLGRAIVYAYDAAGNLATVTDPEGDTTRYTYDGANRLTTISDPTGLVFLQNFYGPSGRVLRQLQADGSEYRFRYRLTGAGSSGGGCTNLTGNVVTVALPFVPCPTVDSWENFQAGYTVTGGTITETTVVDPRGHETTTRFNGRGYRTSVIDAMGQTSTLQRNAANQVVSATDPLGRTTTFDYDAAGNVTKILDPALHETRFTYDAQWNRVTTITDALNQITEFTYDPANGNLLTVKDPLNHVTTMSYNSFGQPISVQGPIATEPPTTFAYDASGNLITTTDPLGNATQRTYDAVGRLLSLTDPRGLVTQFRYDSLNRVIDIADARQGLTRFTYDPNGNLLTVTDAKNQTTAYTYDHMDRLATRKDALNRQESYQYDAAGNLTQFTDRKNQIAAFAYDALNRRTTATYQGDTPASTTTFTYDAGGRVMRASDTAAGAGTIDFGYDTLDRLIQEITGQGTVAYQYDVLGRRTQMTTNGQSPVTYQYDVASRLTRVEQGSLFATLGYDNAGRRTSLGYSNGTTTSYAYDLASRVTAITHNGPNGLIEALAYTYDAAGNRTSLTRANGPASVVPQAVASATYDAANEQTQFSGATLTYDQNGNLTNDGVNTYTWDVRNRLIGLSGGTTASSTYDPLGRRASKTINGIATQFLYDGNDIAAEIGGGAVGATYLRSLNIDEPFIRQSAIGNEHYHTDALGSSLALSTTQGTSSTTYTYEPFGKTMVAGSSGNALQFTGRENDGIGLYYYRVRAYSPSHQRFLAQDPLEFAGSEHGLYNYAFNSPLSFVDPLGLKPPPVVPADADVCSNLRKVEGWKLDRDHWLPNPWVNAVQPNGPWDYKSRTPDLKYENFGNYNAGLTGAALGLDPMTVQGGAGIASAIHNKSGFELKNGLTWFDTPEGNYWVLEGIKDFSDGFWDEKCKPKQPSTSKSAQ